MLIKTTSIVCNIWVFLLLTCTLAFAQNPQIVDSLHQVLKTRIADQQKVDVLNLLAKEYRYMDSAKVAHYTSQSIRLANTIAYPEGVADAWYYISFVKLIKGNRSKAMAFFEKVRQMSQKVGYKRGVANAYNGMGAAYWFKGQMDQARKYYQKSLKIRTQIGDKKGMASTCVNIGVIYKYQGNDTKAIALYQQALRIEQELANKEGMGNCYNNLGVIYTDQGRYSKALALFQNAVKLGKQTRDTLKMISTYGNIGIIHTRQGDYPKAIAFHKHVVALAKSIGNESDLAVSYNNLGIVYRYQGNYPKALEVLQKSLKIREKRKSKHGVAQSFNNIGDIYQAQGNYSKALTFFQEALKKYQQIKYKRGTAISYNHIGIVHELQGSYDQARTYYQKALVIEKQTHLKANVAQSYLGLGRVALLQKQYQKAHGFFEEALKMREEMGEKALSAEVQINLGIAYYVQKDYSQARKYLEKGLKTASKTGLLLFVKYGAEYLAKVYQKTNNPQKALEHHMLFKQMADSLLNKENIQKITRLETQYVAQKREDSLQLVQAQKERMMKADIRRRETTQKATYLGLGLTALLVLVLFIFYRSQQQSNRKLKQVNAELEQSYATIQANAQLIAAQKTDLEQALTQLKELGRFKEKMVGMIAHDLKNPLQAIIGFTQDTQSHPQVNAIHQAAQRMLLLILNMLDTQKFTKTEINPQKSLQSLHQLSKTVMEQVQWFAQAKNIQLEQLATQEIQLSLDAQLISRTLLNLLHNAIKFTPQNGRVVLKYEALPATQEVKIWVIDNGEGMAEEHLDAIFEPYHQANAHQASTGLGLAFCKMVVEAHQGRIGVSSVPGQGSTFWFTLPLIGAQVGVQPLSEKLAHSSGAVIELSLEDKLYLQPYLSQIKEYKIYHFTKIKSILQQIEVDHQPQLALWKDTLKQAIATANQPQYEALINVD